MSRAEGRGFDPLQSGTSSILVTLLFFTFSRMPSYTYTEVFLYATERGPTGTRFGYRFKVTENGSLLSQQGSPQSVLFFMRASFD